MFILPVASVAICSACGCPVAAHRDAHDHPIGCVGALGQPAYAPTTARILPFVRPVAIARVPSDDLPEAA